MTNAMDLLNGDHFWLGCGPEGAMDNSIGRTFLALGLQYLTPEIAVIITKPRGRWENGFAYGFHYINIHEPI